VLRLVRALPEPEVAAPRVLGIDEFALRRGQVYAVLLVDLEAHRPVDVLPEKSADAVAAWLGEHGSAVEVICRDRCAVFADGASRGAPDAVQVADRFHLLRGLGEAAAGVVARHPACLEAEEAAPTPDTPAAVPAPPPEPDAPRPRPLSANQRARQAAVQDLAARGLSISAIARALGLDRKTVRRYARADASARPRPPARRRRTLLDDFLDDLRRHWDAGCRNARRLFREIRARGYRGSYSTVRAYLARPRDGRPPRRRRLATVREAVRLMLQRPGELDEAGRALLGRIVGTDATLTAACRLVRGFAALMRERRGDELAAWVEAALAERHRRAGDVRGRAA
jgi:transposase